jgi:carbamate kinase
MAPKVAAACDFVEQTGGMAAIGALADARAILADTAGTIITQEK